MAGRSLVPKRPLTTPLSPPCSWRSCGAWTNWNLHTAATARPELPNETGDEIILNAGVCAAYGAARWRLLHQRCGYRRARGVSVIRLAPKAGNALTAEDRH